ncbi:hypothetical protein D3C75_1274090 [compost metagenome]
MKNRLVDASRKASMQLPEKTEVLSGPRLLVAIIHNSAYLNRIDLAIIQMNGTRLDSVTVGRIMETE